MDWTKTLTDAFLSFLFALLGFILLFAGYRLFDALTPTDLGRDIFENGNVAAAIFAGAFVIALAIVVSHAIS
jgi:putative membrane protein